MAFGLNFFTLAPGLRVAGDSLAYAYKFTKKGGQGDGKEGLEVGLTDDPTIKLLEQAVSGYELSQRPRLCLHHPGIGRPH